jgi:hypothetical protein
VSSARSTICKWLGCPQPAPPPPTLVTGGPTIALVNRATVTLGLPGGKTLADLATALQQYVSTLLAPAWGTPCHVMVAANVLEDAWGLLLIDTADVANALGYHDLTAAGLPLGKVFVQTIRQYGERVDVTASHELAEMLVDPSINLLATGVVRVEDAYAYEVCDAVEEDPNIDVAGLQLSNFVLPSYFEDFHPPGTRYDHLGVLRNAFTIAPGGYMAILQGGRWTQLFGSNAKAQRFAQEDRRDHRTTLRAKKLRGEPLQRSAHR